MNCANAPCETCPYYDSCSRRIEFELDMYEAMAIEDWDE